MRMDLVSIIVPVYNVKPYLERCVNSLIGQSYRDLEIILVDDGSTDGSGELCDDLTHKDNRIKAIHKSNQGAAAARNAGIDISSGEFICFVDSDDYVNYEYVRYLYEICTKNGADIGMCGHLITDKDDYYELIDFSKPIELYSKDEILDKFFTDMHGSIIIPWNKIYKRKCISDIRYVVGMICEDEATTVKFLYNADKIAFGKEVGYYYFSRPDSITGSAYSKRNLDILKAYESRLLFYKEQGEDKLYIRECQFYLSEILNQYSKVKKFLKDDNDTLKMLRKKYRKAYLSSERNKWTALRRGIYAICFVFPGFYSAMKK